MKCWRCSTTIADGATVCLSCGAQQTRAPAVSEIGKALRLLYDRFGGEEVLTQHIYIVNGLGDLVTDSKKIRGQFRLALEAGIGNIYLEQLKATGNPDDSFNRRVHLYLTENAGLGDKSARQLAAWFNEMIGWNATESSANQKQKLPRSCKILGIDLGLDYVRAAVFEGGEPVLIPNSVGGKSRSCTVGVRDGRILLCEEAHKNATLHPENTVIAFKRNLGTKRDTIINGERYSPQLLTALILRKLREDAERYLGQQVCEAVITVPNGYSYLQRNAVLEAARFAGLEVKRLLNASSAVALAYGFRQGTEQKVLICDFGSGSLDVSVVEIGNGVLEVLAAASDLTLGGTEYDVAIANWLAEEFRKTTGVDLRGNVTATARLREAAKAAKTELTTMHSSHIYVPYLASNAQGALALDTVLTRERFNSQTASMTERAAALIQKTIADSYLKLPEIDTVLLVGGASRMPAFQERVRQLTGKNISRKMHPDESAVIGAALMGGILTGEVNLLLLDVLTSSVGIKIAGNLFERIIDRNTTIPTRRNKSFSTAEDKQSTVDVNVLQGESDRAADNIPLGTLRINNIRDAKSGEARFDVTFDVDQNGIITVIAADTKTGQKYKTDLLANDRMCRNQFERESRLAEEIVPL